MTGLLFEHRVVDQGFGVDYATLELDYDTDPFEVSRERLATLSLAFGFTGIHIFRIHKGKTNRRPEPFK